MFKKIVFMGTSSFAVPILKSLYQNGVPISDVYCQPPKKSMRGQKVNKSPVQKFSEKPLKIVILVKNQRVNPSFHHFSLKNQICCSYLIFYKNI